MFWGKSVGTSTDNTAAVKLKRKVKRNPWGHTVSETVKWGPKWLTRLKHILYCFGYFLKYTKDFFFLMVPWWWWSNSFKSVAQTGWFAQTHRTKQYSADPIWIALISCEIGRIAVSKVFLQLLLVNNETLQFALQWEDPGAPQCNRCHTREAECLLSTPPTRREQSSTE